MSDRESLREARRLLGVATRRPWRVEARGWADGSQTIRCGDGDTDGFGHHSEANAALIVAAVNEYDSHVSLEEAVREYRVKLDDVSAAKIGTALHRLDEARAAASRPAADTATKDES